MIFKGKYIIGHTIVLIVVVSCSLLSFWQFNRLSERKSLNAQIENQMSADPTRLDSILLPGDKDEVVQDFEYRRITVIGKYKSDGEILILGRSRNQEPGYLVLTPLEINEYLSAGNTIEGDIVYINRGWIPQVLGDGLLDDSISKEAIEPQNGYDSMRTVSGLVRQNERPTIFSESDQVLNGVTNRIDTSNWIEVNSISENHMYPLWIQMISETKDGKVTTAQTQARDSYPKILDLPELSERNHLSYAIQWATFGIIALITWIVICYQAVQKQKAKQ